jgi:predicted permease
MRLIQSLRRRLQSLLHKDASNVELSEELRSHLETLVERNIARGMSPMQARIAANTEFGSIAQATEASYESRGTELLDDLAQDIHYGLRSLRRQPAFTFVTVLTLALGIGACTAIFSLVNAVMLRSLPYGDSSRLVYLYLPNPNLKEIPPESIGPSDADFFDIKAHSRSLSAITFFDQKGFSLNAGGQPERVGAAQVESSFFHTLETAPLLGREFSDADQEPGNGNVIILNYALWQSLFAGAPDVLNHNVTLDDKTYRIVGVMPPGFGYPHHTDLAFGNGSIETTQIWVPYTLTAQQKADRDNTSINALARLAPGVTLKDAQAEMSAIIKRLEPLHKGLLFKGMTALLKPLNKQVLGPVRPLMLLLLATVGLVLLIACGNAANLLLARAANRRHELGVRATLGARRGRLLRQMLTESLLFGSAAGIVGIGLAYLFIRALLRLNPGNIPHMESASLDLRALAFLVLISIITSIVFGILPALSATRINLSEFLSSAGTRGLVADRRRTRRMLVSAQVALVVVLLTGAGLFLHSYLNVLSVQTGFSPSTIAVSIPIGAAYNTVEKRRAFYVTLLEKITAQHGIDSAGLVNYLPLTNSESFITLWVDGYPNHDRQLVEARAVTSGYLSAMQTPLLKGRNFTPDEDSPAQHPLAIVNQTFVNKFFAGKDPIGQRLRTGPDLPWSTVIGVVQDIRNVSLETAAVPQIFVPFISSYPPPNGTDVAVRSSLPQTAIFSSIRAAVRSIDPSLAISGIHVMDDFATRATAPRRFQTTLLTLFSAIALFLAVVGVYGLLAYSVRQRTGEIGLRMALGSTRVGIARLILREGLSLLLTGLCLGMAAAIAFARLLRGFLYEVPALDPLTFALVPTLLLIATLAACIIPSARAATTDPMVALRHE